MNLKGCFIFGVCAILLAGCGVAGDVDMTATVSANEAMLAQEIATLNSSSFARRTELVMTLSVKETELAQIMDINQMLGATLAIGSTPTYDLQLGMAQPDRNIEKYAAQMAGQNVNPPMVGGVAPTPNTMIDINAMENRNTTTNITNTGQIVRLGVASQINPDTDCPLDAGTQFSTSVTQLYVVMRTNALPAGAPLAVTWYYGDEIRAQDTWATPRDFDGVCIWFSLERTRTDFTAGEWSVQIFAYNQPVEDRLTFTLTN